MFSAAPRQENAADEDAGGHGQTNRGHLRGNATIETGFPPRDHLNSPSLCQATAKMITAHGRKTQIIPPAGKTNLQFCVSDPSEGALPPPHKARMQFFS
jgi:hypothetical protein